MGPKRRLLALVVLLAASLSACSGDDAPGAGAATGAPPLVSRRAGPVHTLLLTDCAKYQDWQTVAGAFAWRESRQPGAITRIANCKEEDRARYPKALLEYVDTHFAPEVRMAPRTARMARIWHAYGAHAAPCTRQGARGSARRLLGGHARRKPWAYARAHGHALIRPGVPQQHPPGTRAPAPPLPRGD